MGHFDVAMGGVEHAHSFLECCWLFVALVALVALVSNVSVVSVVSVVSNVSVVTLGAGALFEQIGRREGFLRVQAMR